MSCTICALLGCIPNCNTEWRGSETLMGTELRPVLLLNKCLITAELRLAVNYHLCQGQQLNMVAAVGEVK